VQEGGRGFILLCYSEKLPKKSSDPVYYSQGHAHLPANGIVSKEATTLRR